MSVAQGSRRAVSVATASSEMSFAPLVATITGSTTFAISGWRAIRSATTSIAAASANMPVLSARML